MATSKVKSQEFLIKGVIPLKPLDCAVSRLGIVGDAFPVILTPDEKIAVAGAMFGKGRIVQMAHEAYVSVTDEASGWPRLVRNIYKWLAPGICRPKVGILRLGSNKYEGHLEGIKKYGFISSYVEKVDEFNSVDVLLGDTYTKYNDEVLNVIRTLVKDKGKGVFLIGHNWASSNNYANGLLFDCGITVTTEYVAYDAKKLLKPVKIATSSK
ncbi:TRPM8 channel-associated factor homolog [Antedon mediterranea]|uniref:TRPM8 channel-associated factor homolog n=1 Tax=Antedon mediterranea TaxID=105859 RepID=UPI003AF9B01F